MTCYETDRRKGVLTRLGAAIGGIVCYSIKFRDPRMGVKVLRNSTFRVALMRTFDHLIFANDVNGRGVAGCRGLVNDKVKRNANTLGAELRYGSVGTGRDTVGSRCTNQASAIGLLGSENLDQWARNLVWR